MLKEHKNKSNLLSIILSSTVFFVSFIISVLLLIDGNKPSHYSTLFILPLCFGVFSLVFRKIYKEIPSNLGVTLIIVLFFTRLVISPFFMLIGDYSETITLGVEYNTLLAVFLVLYETFTVFILLFFQTEEDIDENELPMQQYNKNEIKRYGFIISIFVLGLIACIIITPELLLTYRTLGGMTESDFTSHEDAYIVSKYGTSFIKKLSLVTGQYLFRALILVVPALIIAKLSKKINRITHVVAVACCCIPLFFIGGAIARSLIYAVCLYLFYNYMFLGKPDVKTMGIVICCAGLAVICWWIIRGSDGNVLALFSRRFSAYFSGVNVVSGVGNLPNLYEFKIRYFLYDFTSTIPYGGTIFQISNEHVQSFFNSYNESSGQIPPTIAMSYYYLGLLFAPTYSLIFALIVVKTGKKLKERVHGNSMKYIRLLLTVFYFSMGIVMYNIEIVMGVFFSLILPMFIIEKISYREKERRNDT